MTYLCLTPAPSIDHSHLPPPYLSIFFHPLSSSPISPFYFTLFLPSLSFHFSPPSSFTISLFYFTLFLLPYLSIFFHPLSSFTISPSFLHSPPLLSFNLSFPFLLHYLSILFHYLSTLSLFHLFFLHSSTTFL